MTIKPANIFALLLALALTFSQLTFAQTDSAYYDLGKVQLLKRQTQAITIKGKDLEKLFSNSLDESIRSFIGYTGPLNYVIDGHTFSDINAYSVYDIEEVSLIEDASGHLNGATQLGRIVVVSTKKASQDQVGIKVSAKSGITTQQWNLPDREGSYTSNVYRQFYVGGNLRLGKVVTGISVDHQRDVYPFPRPDGLPLNITKPSTINRTLINANASVNFNSKYSLYVNAQFVPQVSGYELSIENDPVTETVFRKNNRQILQGIVVFKAKPLAGLENEFRLGYNTFNNRDHENIRHVSMFEGNTESNLDADIDQWGVRNILSYTRSFGKWTLRPSAQLFLRFIEGSSLNSTTHFINSNFQSIHFSTSKTKDNFLTFTPAIDIQYSDHFYLRAGGMFTKIGQFFAEAKNEAIPYVSVSADVARLINPNSGIGVRIFGSHSRIFYNTDLPWVSLITGQYIYANGSRNPPVDIYYRRFPGDKFPVTKGGLNIDLLNRKLIIQYSYDQREYLSGIPTIFILFKNTAYKSHRFAVNTAVVSKSGLEVKSTASITRTKYRVTNNEFSWAHHGFNDEKPLWQAGLTNRISLKNIYFALDALYRFNEQYLIATPRIYSEKVSISIQNIYLGWDLSHKKYGEFSVYAFTRNPVQNQETVFLDQRKYYGIGVDWKMHKK